MTRDEFEQLYAGRSSLTVKELHNLNRFAIPCDCEEPICCGWQMASRDTLSELGIKNSPGSKTARKLGCNCGSFIMTDDCPIHGEHLPEVRAFWVGPRPLKCTICNVPLGAPRSSPMHKRPDGTYVHSDCESRYGALLRRRPLAIRIPNVKEAK